MADFIGALRTEVLRLQISLYACRERLLANTDSEALHDLRVALRRLRSLLKPLKGAAGSEPLQQRAAELGRLSGPLRDLEVLIVFLREHEQQTAVLDRLPQLQRGLAGLLAGPALPALFRALDAWPQELSRQQVGGELHKLDKRVHRYLHKQHQRLCAALLDEQHDPHQVRLLIKRVRYTAQAYPQLLPLSADAQRLLKKTQAALGSWHDHQQWLARAELESDLQIFQPVWRQAQDAASQRMETLRGQLLAALT